MSTTTVAPDDRVVRWYYRTDRWATAATRVLRGAFDGIWLGVLTRDTLGQIDARYYSTVDQYMTDEWNKRGFFDWEREAVDRHFGGVEDVVVTSAGGGREMLALARAGYRVTGYEPHRELVAFGNRMLAAEGVDASVVPCARDRWPHGDEPADAVVVGWSGYMLTAGRPQRVALLRAAARCLPPGGPILLSFLAVVEHDVRHRTAAAVASSLRRARRREAVGVGDSLVPMLVHYFTRAELVSELAEAGLELAEFGIAECAWAVGRVPPREGADGG